MTYLIARNPVDDPALRQARTQALRSYVEDRLSARYDARLPALLRSIVVSRRSDYDEVKVFLTDPTQVEDAKEFLRQIEEELAADGIPIVTYVRTWTAPSGDGDGG